MHMHDVQWTFAFAGGYDDAVFRAYARGPHAHSAALARATRAEVDALRRLLERARATSRGYELRTTFAMPEGARFGVALRAA